MELSDYDCGKSQKCVATYLTEYHNMAVCDGDNGWVIGTLIEKMDCDFSSSSVKSSDSKDNPSSAGTSTKSSNSNTSGNDAKSSSSAGKEVSSSSAVTLATPCKTETEDNCEYGELVDERDGQTYKTVKIGTQTWMAENLNYAYTGVPFDYEGYTSDSTSWCYDNDPANCTKYGRLYTWAAAMDSVGEWSTNGKGCGFGKICSVASAGSATLVRGICPSGWHLPKKAEFETLFTAVGGSSTAGTMLKSTSGWDDYKGESGNGTDAYGFSALPAGYRWDVGNYSLLGSLAYFWSATEERGFYAYYMGLYYKHEDGNLDDDDKDYMYSVRCVKDSD